MLEGSACGVGGNSTPTAPPLLLLAPPPIEP